MKRLSIFEPAMCCPTGLCGVGVNPELMRISVAFDNLRKQGVSMSRYNLNSSPQSFVTNEKINLLLQSQGMDVLPVTMIDNEVVLTMRYPTNEEIETWLDVKIGSTVKEETK